MRERWIPAGPVEDKASIRADLDADVKAFLDAGGRVDRIPTGITGMDYARPRGAAPDITLKGSRPPNPAWPGRGARPSKMDHAKADAVRAAYAKGDVLQRELAGRYGVDPKTISNIITGKAWARE